MHRSCPAPCLEAADKDESAIFWFNHFMNSKRKKVTEEIEREQENQREGGLWNNNHTTLKYRFTERARERYWGLREILEDIRDLERLGAQSGRLPPTV